MSWLVDCRGCRDRRDRGVAGPLRLARSREPARLASSPLRSR